MLLDPKITIEKYSPPRSENTACGWKLWLGPPRGGGYYILLGHWHARNELYLSYAGRRYATDWPSEAELRPLSRGLIHLFRIGWLAIHTDAVEGEDMPEWFAGQGWKHGGGTRYTIHPDFI